MRFAIRTAFAAAATAAALGLAGAGTASARPLPIKPGVKQCTPSVSEAKRFYGVRKIGARYYRVYASYTTYTDRNCHKRVRVAYLKLPLPGYRKS